MFTRFRAYYRLLGDKKQYYICLKAPINNKGFILPLIQILLQNRY